MSTVVYGHFGSVAPAEHHVPQEVAGFSTAELLFGYDEDRATADLQYIDANRPMIEMVSDRVDDMRRNVLLKHPTDAFLDRVEAQRQRFMAETMHWLCEQIILSKREHWSIMAVTYSAYVLEFVARLHQAGVCRQNQISERRTP